jgi:hypothetical protein
VLLGLFAAAFATLEGLKVPVLLAAYVATQVGSTLIAAQFGARCGPRPGTEDKKCNEKSER